MPAMIYGVEVDVAVARPPSPENIRTVYCRIVVDGEPGFCADNEAMLVACWLAERTRKAVVMATASRIVDLEL